MDKRTTYKEPKFYLDGKAGSETAAIFLKYSFAPGQRISYFTGLRIDRKKWSLEEQRVKRNVTGASDVNDLLKRFKTKAEEAVLQSRLKEKPLTKEELKAILDSVNGKEVNEVTFISVLQDFIDSESKLKTWTEATLKKLSTLTTHLEAFEELNRKSNKAYKLRLNLVNESLFEELIEFWLNEMNLRNSTIQKYIELLRWFFSWCNTKGYINESYKAVKINLKKSAHKVIYLDMTEIGEIYKLNVSQNYLRRTRDIFIFQCLTGLRYSDLKNLKASEINETTISVNTIKTGEAVEIELNETTRKILDNHKDHQAATGYALPVPVNQDYNRFLKELAKQANLNEKITLVHYKGNQRIEEIFEKWQLITTHTARRSFITNGLTLGIGSEVIRSWTGHQSEKSFKGYYEIVKNRKRTDMDKMTL